MTYPAPYSNQGENLRREFSGIFTGLDEKLEDRLIVRPEQITSISMHLPTRFPHRRMRARKTLRIFSLLIGNRKIRAFPNSSVSRANLHAALALHDNKWKIPFCSYSL